MDTESAATTPSASASPEALAADAFKGEAGTFGMRTRQAAREAAFLVPDLRQGMAVLDCGCGPGSITVDLAELVAPGPVLGVDVQPMQLGRAGALAVAQA